MSDEWRQDPEERWAAYRTTVFDGPAGAEAFFGQDGEVGIVTAWNPGRLLVAEENAERDRALEAALVEREIPHMRVVGRSPDGGHGEASWAVRSPGEVVIELGREFGQEAVYVVRGEELVLVACDAEGAEGAEVRLGRWRERLVSDAS